MNIFIGGQIDECLNNIQNFNRSINSSRILILCFIINTVFSLLLSKIDIMFDGFILHVNILEIMECELDRKFGRIVSSINKLYICKIIINDPSKSK